MRKLLLVAIAVLLLAPLTKAEKRMTVYGVMFYNLENLFDTINNNGNYDMEFSPNGARQWDGRKYWSKVHNMAYAIGQMRTKGTPYGPAIIGVSEIENETVLQDIIKQPEVKDMHLRIADYHNSPDRRGVDVGVLYNPRFFQVLNVTNQVLTERDFIESGHPEEWNPNMRTRDQMCVTGMLAGEKVSVIVNHWPSRLGGQEASAPKRMATGRLAKRTIDSLLLDDPNQGIVFMGDLNDDPQDPGTAVVMDAKRNIKDVVGDSGLYNPFWEILDKGVGTLAYRGQWNLFDQIIINGYFLRHYGKDDKPTLTYRRAEALNREFLKTPEGDRKGYPLRTYSSGVFLNGFSDHFPTEIFLIRDEK